jgi:hypothetical protein
MSLLKKQFALYALAALVTAAFALDAAAEKIEQTLSKSNPRTASRSAVAIDDVPNHEVGQELIFSDMKSTNPTFKVKEEWVYNIFNYVGGTGPHRGTFVDTHEDGSHTMGNYDGAQKTVSNPDGSWVSTWEGKYRYTGGSGKYKNIKGEGTYKGRATSTGEYREDSKEVLEY